MVMNLSEDSSMEEIMRTALAGDPRLLGVPKKGLKSPERANTTRQLRLLASRLRTPGMSHEDFEEVKNYEHLAARNEVGLLTPMEAREVADTFAEKNPSIIDTGTERWVETD